jgi:hypothetical protein
VHLPQEFRHLFGVGTIVRIAEPGNRQFGREFDKIGAVLFGHHIPSAFGA